MTQEPVLVHAPTSDLPADWNTYTVEQQRAELLKCAAS